MDVRAIGQGHGPSAFRDALGILDGETSRLRGAFAYVSRRGVLDLRAALPNSLRTADRSEWIVSFDFGHTDPRGVALLLSSPRSTVRVMDPEPILSSRFLRPQRIFHPKLLWSTSGTSHNLLIGSANMTHRALTESWELGVLVLGVGHNNAIVEGIREWWDYAWQSATPCTDKILDRYSRLRTERGGETAVEVVTETLVAEPSDLRDARILWAQVGYTSGGGRNQMDLPARVGPFFDLPDQFTVGEKREPIFIFEGQNRHRVAKYHGNFMSRVYLPTSFAGRHLQDIGDLGQHFAIFERISANLFKLRLVPPGDEDWVVGPLRALSEELGQEGIAGDRPYGWL